MSCKDLEVEEVDEEKKEVASSKHRGHQRPEKGIFSWRCHCDREDGDHHAAKK